MGTLIKPRNLLRHNPGRGKRSFSSSKYADLLRPTKPSVQWTSGALSAGVKRAGLEAYNLPVSGTKSKNICSCTSLPLYAIVVRTEATVSTALQICKPIELDTQQVHQ